tara:strand:- start:1567 stop:2760 length:1194 start_codon:yes stop_codon:yes gene_type:complete
MAFYRVLNTPTPVPELLTYQDSLEHLEGFTNSGTADSERRDFRSAVLGAYSDIAGRYDWLYFHTELDIRLDAAYNTGTIQYTDSTRQVTLTGGTWPANAVEGRVKINDIRYPIEERVSDSVITLPTSVNPGKDIAAETSYTWLRTSYTLPADFKNMDPPHTETSYHAITPVSLDGILGFERHVRASSNPPQWYAIGPDPLRYGQMCMFVQYEPDTAEGLRMWYRRHPRKIKYTGGETSSSAGTVQVYDSGEVAGTGTSFRSDMVGSVIRFGDSTNKPTGVRGLNPYSEQRIIKSVNSATSLTLDSSTSAVAAGTKYVVSDPIDLRPTMLEAFFRGCEWKLSLSRRTQDAPPAEAFNWYTEAIRMAGESEIEQTDIWTPPSTYGKGIQAIVTPSVSGG